MNNKFHNFPRLFLPSSIENGQPIIIPENQSHYLKNVLRHVEGNLIRVFNPESGEYIGKITNIGKKHITIEIQNQIRSIEIETTEIHLFFSPIKKDRNDILIEKAVELGVTHFHPVLFARSIVREIKVERIQSQIIEASEQCERLSIPTLAPLKEFKKALNGWDKDIPMMVAIERTDDTLLSKISLKTNRVGLCIGPEGGITEEEIEILKAKKFVTPVSFGKNILRAETAVFYGLSLLSTKVDGL